jgi:hypothetical protein
MLVQVFNLGTGDCVGVWSCSPREAVVAAFAQQVRHDFNTWGYSKYANLVTVGQRTVSCGDYCAFLTTLDVIDGPRFTRGREHEQLAI